MRVLVIGPGYVGLPLAAEMAAEGHEVFALGRSVAENPALTAARVQPLAGDITAPDQLAHLPNQWDWVVNCVSSSRGGPEEYRQVYHEGMKNVLDWLSTAPPKKFVFTSSTSVYGQTAGEAVKETSPTEPAAETGRILVATEQLVTQAAATRGIPSVVLRVAGIYGQGRGYLLHQYLKNEARITGKGDRILNMIHRDDVVGVVKAAFKSGRSGEIYNAVDDEPIAEIHFFRWLSETLGKWMPPFASEEEVSARKRGFTSKKVQNRKLKMELGYVFKYPTFRQGYTAEIQRLDQAGELNIELEPR